MSHYIASEADEKQLVLKFFAQKRNGAFVEVGANDPVTASQTWLLEQSGWHGVLVEPQSVHYEKLRAQRKNSRVFQVACGAPDEEGEMELHIGASNGHSTLDDPRRAPGHNFVGVERVKVTTLDKVLQSAGLDQIDFLSVDVEGHEIEVLRGLNFEKFKPALILIEDHLRDLRGHRFLTSRGYKLVKRTHLNNWYVRRGSDFQMSSLPERIALFRKVVLSLPFRKLKRWLRGRR